jgi:3-isopropylmalate/(R)-2-methylmalate dehydratase small subunit
MTSTRTTSFPGRGVLAKSFARIFFRNAINCGLFVVECDTDKIENGDEVTVDLEKGEVVNLTRGVTLSVPPLPQVMIDILREGGLVNYFKKYGSFEKA